MSDPENMLDADNQNPADELEMLKTRAATLGLKYAAKIGVDALRKKVAAALSEESQDPEEDEDEDEEDVKPVKRTKQSKAAIYAETHARMQRDEMKLVRVVITCLNPSKADLKGEILCVANKFLGIVKKFVPFGEATEEGYQLPQCLYNELKSRKFLSLRSFVDRKTQQTVVEQKWVPEFNLEVLDQLTADDLAQMARMQAAKEGL